jgi:alkyl sulfatase BDS1-like metallo-beta-lactamase superfamily hydrolase
MRDPLYKKRPGEPNAAVLGGERINDFITMSEGFSNCYRIETNDGDIQINAGMGFEAPVHRLNFEALSAKAARYLILTQGHTDHVGGVAHFREQYPELLVIAQAGNTEHQAYDGRLAPFRAARSGFAFRDKIKREIEYINANIPGGLVAQDSPVPDILFEDRYELEHGGLRLELIGVPGAETNDSLIVWLPEQRICFTGNLFGCLFGHFPNLVTIRGDRYREPLVCAAAVERVRELEPEMILYGHHEPIVGASLVSDELTALRDAIHYVHDETVKGMNEGKDVHTLMSEIGLPPELEVGEGYGKVSWGVRAIWESYAGWFHHESTTELYSVPRSAVHADLLELAGGSDALVDRAIKRSAAGELAEALHLLDIVLEQEPDHEAAAAASIEAHERLRSESRNFWLSSWLDNQLSLLRRARG